MQIQTLVIGMDFSDDAIAAARWAVRHLAPSATPVFVHAIGLPEPPPFAPGLLPDPEVRAAPARDRAARMLRELARDLGAAHADIVVRQGRASDVIVAVATERAADIIVVGPHGVGSRRSILLGTTADRLVRTTTVPVLVATGAGDAPPSRLLVPVDGSGITRRVLAWARDLAESFDADITLLNVWRRGDLDHVKSLAAVTTSDEQAAAARVEEELEADARTWIESLAAAGVGLDRTRVVLAAGKPGETILALALDQQADMIVLGRGGRGHVAPALLGSTVRTVLHGSACPVLVVTD